MESHGISVRLPSHFPMARSDGTSSRLYSPHFHTPIRRPVCEKDTQQSVTIVTAPDLLCTMRVCMGLLGRSRPCQAEIETHTWYFQSLAVAQIHLPRQSVAFETASESRRACCCHPFHPIRVALLSVPGGHDSSRATFA